MPTKHHAFFEIFESCKELRNVLFSDVAEYRKIRRTFFCIFRVKPYSDLVPDEQLIREVRCRVKEHEIVIPEGELFNRPIQLFSQINLLFCIFSCIFRFFLLSLYITLLKEAIVMGIKAYPVIDLVATGNNIRRLRLERGMTVRDLQSYFGFEEPRAIYKWQKGESLPTVDNLYALGNLFEVPMDQILVPVAVKLHIVGEQQAESCCSSHFLTDYFGYGKSPMQLQPFVPFALSAA